MTFTIKRNSLTAEEKERFERYNPGYVTTGDTIILDYIDRRGNPNSEELVIFKAADRKHDRTRYGMARQTSKYIILARYDRYYKLTLNGKIVSLDAEDNNSNR